MEKEVKGETKLWYAIYVKPKWEKKVDELLTKKGITSWCPTQKKERQWTDRKKIINEPLFRSYVFVNIDLQTERLDVLKTDGALNLVYYNNKPAVIKNEEVENIKRYLSEKDAIIELLAIEGFKPSTKVKITHGVFMDHEGTVIRGGRKKVYVQLESLGKVMMVEFSAQSLSLVS